MKRYYRQGLYTARSIDGDSRPLGFFTTVEDAAKAVDLGWRFPSYGKLKSIREIARQLHMTEDEVERVLASALLKLCRGLTDAFRDYAVEERRTD